MEHTEKVVMTYFVKKLKDDEILVRIVRRHFLTFFWPLLLSVFLILLTFFFLFPLFSLGIGGRILFLFLFILGISFLIRTLLMIYFNSLVITDKRIIYYQQKGLFDLKVSESDLEKIRDVSYHIKGPLETIFRWGTLHIKSQERVEELKIKKIKNPDKVQEIILALQKEVLEEKEIEKEKLSAEELIKMVTKIRETLGEEKFQKIIRSREGQSTINPVKSDKMSDHGAGK